MTGLKGRTAILIGGTAYSGSTLLDMLLANDPHGFSCGELHAVIQPYLEHHFSPRCGCGDPDCTVWEGIRNHGEQAHEHLLTKFPETRFLVDSSKDVAWLKPSADRLAAAGADVRNVLIWKTPGEYFKSRQKRGEEKGWAESWIRYHKAYMALMDPFVAIRYADLVKSTAALKALCHAIGLPYFEGKENYWEKSHHTLFGNASAKIHLHSEDSADFQRMSQELDNYTDDPDGDHRPKQALYYEDASQDAYAGYATPADELDFQEIMTALVDHGPDGEARSAVPWGLANAYLGYTRLRRWMRARKVA